MRCCRVAIRAELLRCVSLGVALQREEYDRVPILPAAVVRLMMLSADDRQISTPTGVVTLHGVGSWLRRAGDVPKDQRVVATPPLLEAPVQFA